MTPLVFLTILIASVSAQRPSYLGGPTYPELANRFKTDNDDSTVSVNNRLGESGGTTEKIPVDARGDNELVNRLNTWPRQNKPFWLLNADHIERHRNPQGNQVSQVQDTQSRLGAQQNNLRNRFYDPYQDDQYFYDYYFRPRPRFNSFRGEDDTITRPIRPVQTRSSFLGPL